MTLVTRLVTQADAGDTDRGVSCRRCAVGSRPPGRPRCSVDTSGSWPWPRTRTADGQ